MAYVYSEIKGMVMMSELGSQAHLQSQEHSVAEWTYRDQKNMRGVSTAVAY